MVRKSKEVSVEDLVNDAMPQGEIYTMPEEWRSALAEIPQRYESPSSIRSYMTCPLRWYLERYSDLESQPSGFPAVVGSFVHRVLEVFYSEPAHYRNFDLLNRTFRTAWDAIKQNSGTGIIPPDLQAEFEMLEELATNPDGMRGGFFSKARKCIEAVPDFDEDPSAVNVIKTETWVRTKQNGIIIRGKIDREIKAPLGGSIIQDWKTGKMLPHEDEKVSVLSDSFIPIGLYALMRSRGNQPDGMDSQLVSSVQLLYLDPRVKYNLKIRKGTLEQVEMMLHRVTEEMNNTVMTGEMVVDSEAHLEDGTCDWCPAMGSWFEDGGFERLREEMGI